MHWVWFIIVVMCYVLLHTNHGKIQTTVKKLTVSINKITNLYLQSGFSNNSNCNVSIKPYDILPMSGQHSGTMTER